MDKKVVIIVALVTGVLVLGGLYISTSFRLSGALNDTRGIRQVNRQLIQSNDFLGDQLNTIGLTVNRLDEDKRKLREQLSAAQASVGSLTRDREEAERLIIDLGQQNNRFGVILERYKVGDLGIPGGTDSSRGSDNLPPN